MKNLIKLKERSNKNWNQSLSHSNIHILLCLLVKHHKKFNHGIKILTIQYLPFHFTLRLLNVEGANGSITGSQRTQSNSTAADKANRPINIRLPWDGMRAEAWPERERKMERLIKKHICCFGREKKVRIIWQAVPAMWDVLAVILRRDLTISLLVGQKKKLNAKYFAQYLFLKQKCKRNMVVLAS